MSATMNFVIHRGENFSISLTITDDNGFVTDLSNFTFFSTIKCSFYSSQPGVSFTVTSGDCGEIVLSLTAAETLQLRAGRYVFDVLSVALGGEHDYPIRGQVTVMPTVTRAP